MHRTIRWIDRCMGAHKRPHDQSLFGIVQGGLDLDLRAQCCEVKRAHTHTHAHPETSADERATHDDTGGGAFGWLVGCPLCRACVVVTLCNECRRSSSETSQGMRWGG